VIAEALAAACPGAAGAAILARIGGPLGEAARARARELAPLTEPARRARRAAWAAAVRTPVPRGIRGVDPSWIEAGLAALPARARADVANGGLDPAGVWLARWATASLAPLPADVLEQPPATLDELVRVRGDVLVEWLADVGADQLALALGAAGEGARRAAISALADRSRTTADRVARAAIRITAPPRAGALGPTRAAIARCKLPALDDDALVRIGARTLAPHTDTLVRRQLALRLPRPRGLAVLAELRAFAAHPLASAPAWAALAAP